MFGQRTDRMGLKNAGTFGRKPASAIMGRAYQALRLR
jgi:hypothetical protein